MFIPPYRISLSGGGIKGLAHVGALEVLQEHGGLVALKELIGISAGALCAFCLAVGCTLAELRLVVTLLDFGTIRAIDPDSVLSFPESFGIDTGANLEKLLVAILRGKRLPPDLTFAELAERGLGPALRVFATDLNTCRSVEFSAETAPDVEIVLGLRASMCIPIYFQPVRDPRNGHLLVDGGVICHSPLKFLSPAEQSTTLSITFSDSHKPKEAVGSLLGFLAQLYYTLDYQYNEELTTPLADRVMFLDCSAFSSLHFEATADQRLGLLEAGRSGAEEWLARQAVRQRSSPEQQQPRLRRFSHA